MEILLGPFGTFLFVGHLRVVSALIETAAASRRRTPLTEFAVRAFMLLMLAVFKTADESIGHDLETDSTLPDKLFFIISHSFYPPSSLS